MSNHTPDTFRVLVIDDEKAILEQFRYVFEPQTETGQNKTELADLQGKLFGLHNNRRSPINIEATFCRQGDEAVEIVRQAVEQHNPFAVAYCDIRMPPGPNGLWTAEHIRRLDNNVHIVMVTAFSDIDPLEFTERVRPPDKLLYVQKPFHPQEIRQFTTALSARWLTEQFSTLQSKNEAIKESDKLKRDFIITVSHELRTPLAIFKNVISNAMAGVTGHLHPKLRDNLAMADNSLNRLAALISDFIDIADIDADQLILDPHPIPIQQVIRDAIRTMEPQARAKKIDLTAVMPQQEIITNGDRRRLKQTLLNLIGNGIRYIPEKGKVCVLLSENDDELRLVVEDNGPGIERNEIESVFSRFVQVQRQVGEGEHGTGLGLTIARTIVELHGGKMWLESTPGRGASFCFTLPKYKPAATDEQSADTLQTSLCR